MIYDNSNMEYSYSNPQDMSESDLLEFLVGYGGSRHGQQQNQYGQPQGRGFEHPSCASTPEKVYTRLDNEQFYRNNYPSEVAADHRQCNIVNLQNDQILRFREPGEILEGETSEVSSTSHDKPTNPSTTSSAPTSPASSSRKLRSRSVRSSISSSSDTDDTELLELRKRERTHTGKKRGPRPKILTLEEKRKKRADANDRERERMGKLNSAFNALRHLLPKHGNDRELSKFETIQIAKNYIKALNHTLEVSETNPDSRMEAMEAFGASIDAAARLALSLNEAENERAFAEYQMMQ